VEYLAGYFIDIEHGFALCAFKTAVKMIGCTLMSFRTEISACENIFPIKREINPIIP
jgi:hypothetical protein